MESESIALPLGDTPIIFIFESLADSLTRRMIGVIALPLGDTPFNNIYFESLADSLTRRMTGVYYLTAPVKRAY